MKTAEDYLARAIRLYGQERVPEADAWTQTGIARSPHDGLLWELWGTACWMRSDFAHALPALENAGSLVPLSIMGQCASADCYVHADRPSKAAVILRRLATDADCPPELDGVLASGLEAIEEYRLALELFQRLARRQTDDHRAWFEIAYLMALLEYPNAATEVPLCRAFLLAPHVLHYRLNLACLRAKLGQLESAYLLVAGLPADAVSRPFWLHKLTDLYHRVGDRKNGAACRHRLAHLETSHACRC